MYTVYYKKMSFTHIPNSALGGHNQIPSGGTVTDLDACKKICIKHPDCKTFDFDTKVQNNKKHRCWVSKDIIGQKWFGKNDEVDIKKQYYHADLAHYINNNHPDINDSDIDLVKRVTMSDMCLTNPNFQSCNQNNSIYNNCKNDKDKCNLVELPCERATELANEKAAADKIALDACNTEKTTAIDIAQNNLNTCNTSKTTLQTELNTCNAEKKTAQDTCNAEKNTAQDTCNSDKNTAQDTCNSDKKITQDSLATCTTDKTTAQNNLATCTTDKQTAIDEITTCHQNKSYNNMKCSNSGYLDVDLNSSNDCKQKCTDEPTCITWSFIKNNSDSLNGKCLLYNSSVNCNFIPCEPLTHTCTSGIKISS